MAGPTAPTAATTAVEPVSAPTEAVLPTGTEAETAAVPVAVTENSPSRAVRGRARRRVLRAEARWVARRQSAGETTQRVRRLTRRAARRPAGLDVDLLAEMRTDLSRSV
jgi:hypothetical protein